MAALGALASRRPGWGRGRALAVGSSLAVVLMTLAVIGSVPVPYVVTSGRNAPAGPRPAYADAPGDWPMFHHDAARTGYNAEETVLQPPLRLKWSYGTGGAVRTSPAVAGRTVYAVAEDQALYFLDAEMGARKPSLQANNFIFSASPALAGGVLYQGAADGTLYALDAATGRTLWTYLTGSPVRSAPAVTGGTVYFTSGTVLYALDAQTGSLRWSYATRNPIYASPAVADGVVYAVFVYPPSVPPPGYPPYSVATSEMVALEAATGVLRWTVGVPYSGSHSPAVSNGVVYVTGTEIGRYDDFGYIKALDAQTGAERWSYLLSRPVSSSPAVANGVLYAGADDLRVHAVDANTGSLKWVSTTGGSITSSPAVANGVVYVGSSDGAVYGMDAATGAVRWKYDTGAAVGSSPAVAGGVLYVGSDSGQVYAFESQAASAPSIPNLSVTKIASKGQAHPGDALTYLIFLDNSGPAGFSVALTDTIPPGVSYITDTVSGGATYSPTINSVLWAGTVPPADSSLPSRVFQFRARVEDWVSTGAIANTLLVGNGAITVSATARTDIWRPQAFLPSLFKGSAGW